MAQFRCGDIFAPNNWQAAGLILITTNATINEQGHLIMGAGAAKIARDKFTGVAKALGQVIQEKAVAFSRFEHGGRSYRVYQPPYGLLVSPGWPEKKLGAFQVKSRFCDDASLDLIAQSTEALLTWAVQHPHVTIHLNYPGIGNGRLERGQVKPIISKLPDNVIVWEL